MSKTKWIFKESVKAIVGAGALKLFLWLAGAVMTTAVTVFAYDTGLPWYFIIVFAALTFYAMVGAANRVSLIIERWRNKGAESASPQVEGATAPAQVTPDVWLQQIQERDARIQEKDRLIAEKDEQLARLAEKLKSYETPQIEFLLNERTLHSSYRKLPPAEQDTYAKGEAEYFVVVHNTSGQTINNLRVAIEDFTADGVTYPRIPLLESSAPQDKQEYVLLPDDRMFFRLFKHVTGRRVRLCGPFGTSPTELELTKHVFKVVARANGTPAIEEYVEVAPYRHGTLTINVRATLRRY